MESQLPTVEIEMPPRRHVVIFDPSFLRTTLPVLIQPADMFLHGHTSRLATKSVELGRQVVLDAVPVEEAGNAPYGRGVWLVDEKEPQDV